MHVSMPTRLCPHGGRQQLCTQYICTPTNPLKIPSFSSSYSSSPSHPSSATVVFIQSRVWRVIQLPSDSLQDHRWKQTWLALLFFFFFWCLHNLQTPYHEDVSSELRPYKAGERGSSEAVRGGGKKSNRFYFSFAAILPVAPVPRREMDWARFASAGTWVQHAGHRGRLKAGSWKKKYNTKKRSKSRTNWYFRDEEGDFIIFLSCALWFCEKKRPATAFIFVLFLLQKPALTPARGTGTWINSAYKPATLYTTSGVRRKIWNFMWALLSRHIIAPNVITHSRC